VVERLERECEKKNHAWSTARAKHKSLDKAVTNHRTREAARQERREQQLSDERGQGQPSPMKEGQE
jgi:flagellar export protein FliJ